MPSLIVQAYESACSHSLEFDLQLTKERLLITHRLSFVLNSRDPSLPFFGAWR